MARRNIEFEPFSLRGVVLLTLLFGLANALVRLTAGVNLALDDTKENIFTQKLAWGYLPDNPPLYEWLLTLVQQLTGPNLFSFLIVKYGLMTVTAVFVFLAGRRLFRSEKWAALTVYSTIMLYQLGYNYHQAFTHSLMVIAAVTFSLWAFVRLMQEHKPSDYALFGLSIGLGLLSKYNFTGFLAVVLLPALFDKELRVVLLSPRFLLSIIIAGLIAAPHYLWVMANQDLFFSYVTNKLGQTDGSHLSRIGEGLGNMVVAVISFFVPFLILGLFAFRNAFTKLAAIRSADDTLIRLLGHSSLVALIVIAAGIILFGVSNVTERYVIPFFLPGYFWLIWLMRSVSTPQKVALWGKFLAGFAGIIIFVRFIGVFYPGEPVCDDCQRWRPYASILETVEQAGLDPAAIYVGYEEDTAGNLRRLLPAADVRSFNLLFYQPIEAAEQRECYFVWSEELLGQPVEGKVRHITDNNSTLMVNANWVHPLKEQGWRQTRWGISPVLPSSPLYEVLCTP